MSLGARDQLTLELFDRPNPRLFLTTIFPARPPFPGRPLLPMKSTNSRPFLKVPSSFDRLPFARSPPGTPLRSSRQSRRGRIGKRYSKSSRRLSCGLTRKSKSELATVFSPFPHGFQPAPIDAAPGRRVVLHIDLGCRSDTFSRLRPRTEVLSQSKSKFAGPISLGEVLFFFLASTRQDVPPVPLVPHFEKKPFFSMLVR